MITKTLQILLLILLISPKLSAQYENIIFEGAGIKGLAYAGVIKALEDQGKIKEIERVGGTSAGAITALMLSIGYTSEEIYDIISSMKFQRLNQGRLGPIGGIHRMNKKYGWYRTGKFEKWIRGIIEQKTGDPDLTFEELKDRGYKDLYLVATCLNRQTRVVLSRETYPKMKVSDAVKISMSIPLYFEANFVDEEGRVYKKKKERAGKDILVDGGIIGNYPIDIFDSLVIDSKGNEKRIANEKTLGVRIDTKEQIARDINREGLEEIEIKNFRSYMVAFYTLTIESLNRNTLTEADWERTISVSSMGIGPKIKRLSLEEKMSLMESGERAVNEFLGE